MYPPIRPRAAAIEFGHRQNEKCDGKCNISSAIRNGLLKQECEPELSGSEALPDSTHQEIAPGVKRAIPRATIADLVRTHMARKAGARNGQGRGDAESVALGLQRNTHGRTHTHPNASERA